MKLTDRTQRAVTTFVLVAVIVATGSAQTIQRVTIAGINNFWRVDDTVSTGGTITSREMAIPELKRRGIRSVIITLTSQTGEKRRTLSSAFGSFRLTDVPAGATYVLTAQAKHYQFTQPAQVYFITGNLNEIVFTATR